MKKPLAIIFLSGLLFTACGGNSSSVKPADKILDDSIFTEATGSGSISRCNDILDKELKASCEKVIEDRTATNAALADMDKSKCSKVSDERYKKECETQVDAKIEMKNAESQQLQIAQSAADKGDVSICEQIKDENQKASCQYNIYTNQALQKKDAAICDKISKKNFIDECKQSLGNGTKN